VERAAAQASAKAATERVRRPPARNARDAGGGNTEELDMPKTSTAEANNYICPKCKNPLARDHEGRGFVRHLKDPGCDFEKGERDEPVQHVASPAEQRHAEPGVAPRHGGT